MFAQLEMVGNDLLVILWGGRRPHIGAVGIAQSCPSLKDPRRITVSSSVFTFLGHKEDIVVKKMSEEIARKLNKKVVVVAGMHWEELQKEEIEGIMEVCQRIREKALGKLKGLRNE